MRADARLIRASGALAYEHRLLLVGLAQTPREHVNELGKLHQRDLRSDDVTQLVERQRSGR